MTDPRANDAKLSGKRVLVTGAAGFIGVPLVEALLAAGAEVTGFGRGKDAFDGTEVQWGNGNFDDPMALVRACEGQDVVYHLLNSSTPSSATQHPVGDVTANLVPSIHLLEASVKAKVGRFVFFSSGGTVYGHTDSALNVEDSLTEPQSAYGISKLAIEKYVRLISDTHGMEYRILRVSNPYGPGQSPFRKQGIIAAAMHAILTGKQFDLWGDGEAIRDFVYIDDVVSASLLMAHGAGEDFIYNVGSGVGRSINDVLRDVASLVPERTFNIVRFPGRKVDVSSNVLDVTRLRRAGWAPAVPWDVGLANVRAWLEAEYGLEGRPPATS